MRLKAVHISAVSDSAMRCSLESDRFNNRFEPVNKTVLNYSGQLTRLTEPSNVAKELKVSRARVLLT